MEHVPGGELFEYVQKQEGIAESGAREMFEEIAKGVKHCHCQGVAHRDLKLENILLDSSNKPKVSKRHLKKIEICFKEYCIFTERHLRSNTACTFTILM